MIAYWPASLPQKPRIGTWIGGPKDTRRVFQPDIGAPMLRPGSTADVLMYSGAVFPNLHPDQRLIFEAFWRDDLLRGSQPFVWREPENGVVGLWLIAPGDMGYSMTSKGAGLTDLTLSLIRKPGNPWFAPYILEDSNQPPYVVADYVNGIFGVDCVRTAASAVALVAGGPFTVVQTWTPPIAEYTYTSTLVAGDIPATQPAYIDMYRVFEQ